MEIKPDIFRAYDIRGVYPQEINSQIVYLIGRAFVKFLGKKKPKIVISMDNRLSSPLLYKAVKKGILEAGGNVVDTGLNPTPVFYFAVWKHNFDGGIQITASHNPPQYNGCKIVKKGAVMVGENTGLKKLKKMVFEMKKGKQQKNKPGKVIKKNVLKDYLDFNLKGLNLKKIKPLKIAIDTGNAVSGLLVEELKKKLPCKIYHLFPKLDGSFPNHLANPSEDKNIKALKKAVREKKLDLGAAFDGDGDRIVFVNEKGERISADYITCLVSEKILARNPGAKIVYTVCSSNIVRDVIKENKGLPIAVRVGFTFIKEKAMKVKALFAAEYSSHFCFKSHKYCEAPLKVLFQILKEISPSRQSISTILRPFKRYFTSEIINLEVRDKKRTLKALEKEYGAGKISRLDGIRLDFKDWWFNARPSNTENLLRIIVEAESKKEMEKRKSEIKKLVKHSK